jgi:release factor glutamine methyltransferase
MSAAKTYRGLLAECDLPKHELWPLIEAASGRRREFILAHDSDLADMGTEALFCRWINQRKAGAPIAYLTGCREFYGRPFWVNRHTLIPRMETELLIDTAKALLGNQQKGPLSLCDLGTGSGCIAVTLALEFPAASVTATDRSAAALRVARNNAAWLDAGRRVAFLEGSWWEALGGRPQEQFHGIVSNPPYIAPDDHHLAQGDLRFEPGSALSGQGTAGLGDIETIVRGAVRRLYPNGFLLMEHGFDQQPAVIDLLNEAGFNGVRGLADMANNPRAVLGFRA